MEKRFNAQSTGTEVAEYFKESIKGRVFLITGVSPSSLGAQLALNLSHHNPALLILASRTLDNIQIVASAISALNPDVKVKCIVVDFSSFSSICDAVSHIHNITKGEGKGIDVLFNNAGINISERKTAPEGGGMEMQFVTNHLGPFLFTNLLLPLLTSSLSPSEAQARIINTSSEAHRITPIRFSDLNQTPGYLSAVPPNEQPRKGLPEGVIRGEGGYEASVAYGMSKCANILMAVGLRGRMEGKGVGCWSVNPGNIMTSLPRGLDERAKEVLMRIREWKTLDQGVATLLVAGLDQGLSHEVGVYLDDCKVRRPAKWACDEDAAERLWKVSYELVGLDQGKKAPSKL